MFFCPFDCDVWECNGFSNTHFEGGFLATYGACPEIFCGSNRGGRQDGRASLFHNIGNAWLGAAHRCSMRTASLRGDQQGNAGFDHGNYFCQKRPVIITPMDRDHAIQSQQLSLAGLTEHINGADDLELFRPERGCKWRVKDRDMIHGNHVRLAIGNILFSDDPYACQGTEEAAKNKLGNRPRDFETKGNTICLRITHLTKARICSKTSSALSLSESSTMASSAAFRGATSRVESMRSRSI